MPLRRAEAQPGQRIDDHAQAIPALEAVRPAIGPVAGEMKQELARFRPGQRRPHLAGQRLCACHRPSGQQAGVHQHMVAMNLQ